MKRLLTLLLAGLMLLTPLSALAEAPNPTISSSADKYDPEHPELLEPDQLAAYSALVMEESSGEIIFEKDIDRPLYPASTTKIMTVLLGILCCELDEEVTVSYNAINVGDPDATMIGLDEGEIITMEDLLYATLLRSGNDGANAIAEHVSGSISAFVNLMNTTARDLGMENTYFVNPHGLHDPRHVSTARDLAILARYAMSNETFRKIANTRVHSIDKTNTHRQRSLTTRHRIMLETYSGEKNSYYYEPMTGIKSGSHSMAAYCYVGSASRDGVDLISVVMCSGRYDNMRDTKKLMEYGFSQFTSITVSDLYRENPIKVYTSGYSLDDQGLGELVLSAVPVDPSKTPLITVLNKDIESLSKSMRDMMLIQYTRDLVAPITAGEAVGTMTYIIPTTGEVVEYNLLASRTVPERTDLPPTLAEIAAMTDADPNPFPPLTPEVILILLSPFILTAILIFVVWLIIRQYKRFYARLPRNRNRYVK